MSWRSFWCRRLNLVLVSPWFPVELKWWWTWTVRTIHMRIFLFRMNRTPQSNPSVAMLTFMLSWSFAYGKHNFFHICIIFSSYLTIIKEFEKNWVLVYRPEQTRIGNNNNNNVIKIWWKITIYYYKFMVRGLHNAILYCCCYYYYYYFNIYGTLNIKNKIKKK